MKYKIAVFPGDGVGPELINEGIKLIEKAAELDKFNVEFVKYPYGAEHYLETKELLSEKALSEIKNSCNAIYCGTFDNSKLNSSMPDKSISGFIRNYFEQFCSLRPIKLFPNVECPIAGKTSSEIDFVIIRENTEDFYIGASGRAKNGKNKHKIEVNRGLCKVKFGLDIEAKGNEIAYQIGILSRKGCERVIKYAFDYAKAKSKKNIAVIDKANMLDSYTLWRDSADNAAKDYPEISCEFNIIGAAVMNFIRQPEKYEVIVAPNMFGGILSDLGAMLQGGQQKSSSLIIKAIESVLKEGKTLTQDVGGNNTTLEMGDAIADKFVEIHD